MFNDDVYHGEDDDSNDGDDDNDTLPKLLVPIVASACKPIGWNDYVVHHW